MDTAPELLLLIASVAALLLGTGLRHLFEHSRIPHSVVLLVCGLLFGSLARQGVFVEAGTAEAMLDYLAHLDPHLILALFLPVLIFQSALSLDPHLFQRLSGQISILAIPGVIVSTLMTAALCKWILPLGWGWPESLLMGALISATDPVAVVALLKETGARHRLETLVEGESLLNDGTAIVLFLLFVSLLEPGNGFNLGNTAANFVLVALGGAVLGWLVGVVLTTWMEQLYRAPVAQISLSVAAAYLTYLLAEFQLHVSGVVALVTLGVLLSGKNRLVLSPAAAEFLKSFWALMADMANTLIFLLVGVTIAIQTPISFDMPWLELLMLFVGVMAIRGIMLVVFFPVLRLAGSFTWAKLAVLFWGALRGAIALVLALSLVREGLMPADTAQQILFLTAGVVILTLLINGTTMPLFLGWLKLDRIPDARKAAACQVANLVDSNLQKKMAELSKDYLMKDVDWQLVREQTSEEPAFSEPPVCSLEKRSREYYRQLLNEQKQCYWSQLDSGYIGKEAFRHLYAALEQALDNQPTLEHFHLLKMRRRMPLANSSLWNISWVRNLLVSVRYRHLLIGYDIDRGYYYAQQQLQQTYADLAPDEPTRESAKQAIEAGLRQSHMRIESLRSNFPEIVHALENSSATRILLFTKIGLLRQALHEGILDEKDAEQRLNRVLDQLDRLNRKPISLKLPSMQEKLHGLPQFSMLSGRQLDKLIRKAERCYFGEDELICKQGELCGDLLLLLRGSVESIRHTSGSIADMKMLGPGLLISNGLQPKAGITARSMMSVEVLQIPAEQVADMAAESPEFAHCLLESYFG